MQPRELVRPQQTDSAAPPTGYDSERRPPSEWGARIDALCSHLMDLALVWAWPLLYGLLAGSSLWWLTHPAAVPALGHNRLADDLRSSALTWTLLGGLLLPLGYAIAHLSSRLKAGSLRGRKLTTTLNWWGLPALTLPFLVAVARPLFERRHPQMAVFFPLLIGAVWAVLAYRLKPPGWLERLPDKVKAASALAAVVAAYAAYGFFFSRLAITNHHALHTATFDLGLYDNIFYQSLHGTPLGCSFLADNYHGAAHFDPILVLLTPFYALYQRAESILVLQSFWMGAGVFPLYLLAKKHLRSRSLALVLSSTWLLYAPLQGANMYDFHSLSLIAPLLVTLYYFSDAESRWGYWVTLAALLLVREDVPLLLCFIAAAGIISRKPFAVRQGWLTIIVSIAYFLLAKGVFMGAPENALKGTQTYTFAFYYKDLIPNNRGLGELLQSLLTNPAYAAQIMVLEDKAQFLLLVFAPLGFLPLMAGWSRLPLLYGFAFCLLASREAVYSIYFQYVCLLFAVAFSLTPEGLVRVTRFAERGWGLDPGRFRRAAVGAVWLSSVLLCFKWGGIVENDAFRGGFSRPKRELDAADRTRYEWVRTMVDTIPKEASVGATRRMGPHISNRNRAFGYPSQTPYDYLFLDEGQLDKKQLPQHRGFLETHDYETVGRSGKLVLYRRKNP